MNKNHGDSKKIISCQGFEEHRDELAEPRGLFLFMPVKLFCMVALQGGCVSLYINQHPQNVQHQK